MNTYQWFKYCILLSSSFVLILSRVNGQDIVLPMTYRNGENPMIEVLINGQGPFKFMFDTGRQGLLKLDENVFTALRLIRSDSILAGDGSGQHESWQGLTMVDNINIGGYQINEVQAMIRNYNRRPNMDRVDGIIGLDFFKGRTVCLDFNQNTFTISSVRLKSNDSNVYQNGLERGIPTMNVEVGTTIINAVFDTGNTGNLTLHEQDVSAEMLKGNPIVVGKAQTINNTFEIKQAQLKVPIIIAGHKIDNALININGLLPKANMGIKFLKQFNISFDIENALCRIEKNTVSTVDNISDKSYSNEYTGQYGDRTISCDKAGQLFIQRPGGMLLKMTQKEKDTFGLEIVADALLVFERNTENKIVAIKVKRNDSWEKAERTN